MCNNISGTVTRLSDNGSTAMTEHVRLTLESLPFGLVQEIPVRDPQRAVDPMRLMQVQRDEEELIFLQRRAAATSTLFLGVGAVGDGRRRSRRSG